MGKELTILLNGGPFSSDRADLALRVALKARERSHHANLFCYVDGVWLAHLKADNPYVGPGRLLQEAVQAGVNVMICSRCADGRDLAPEETVEGVHRASLFDFLDCVNRSDRVLAFAE